MFGQTSLSTAHKPFICCCAVQIGAAAGLPFPQWYDAGKTADIGNWSFGK